MVFLILSEQSNVELDLTFGRQQKVNNPHVKVSYRRSSQSFQLLTPQNKDVWKVIKSGNTFITSKSNKEQHNDTRFFTFWCVLRILKRISRPHPCWFLDPASGNTKLLNISVEKTNCQYLQYLLSFFFWMHLTKPVSISVKPNEQHEILKQQNKLFSLTEFIGIYLNPTKKYNYSGCY